MGRSVVHRLGMAARWRLSKAEAQFFFQMFFLESTFLFVSNSIPETYT